MKILKSILVGGILLVGMTVSAQDKSLKIGYTNVEAIVGQLPESKQIQKDLEAYKSQLSTQLQSKGKEFQDKLDTYEKGKGMMSDVVRADKERELQFMQGQIEEFQKNAETSMGKKQETLLQPILAKVQKAIDDVANENGYTYVFNSDGGMGLSIILHAPEKDDVTPLVLKKMGVVPAAATTTPSTSGSVKPAIK